MVRQMTLPRILKRTKMDCISSPTSVLEAFKDIEIGQSIKALASSLLNWKIVWSWLGSDQDYLQFGYDKETKKLHGSWSP